MPKREKYDNGVPSWVDLATTDVDEAKQYYSELFGWRWTGGEMPGGETYWMATLQDELIAGVMASAAESAMGSVWHTYVNVDNVDATLAKAVDGGASVVMPAVNAGDAGRVAFFTDPGGAALGLWQPKTHPGAGLVNEHGAFIWNEAYVEDTAKAKEFYGAVFGWSADSIKTPEGLDYTMFKLGDAVVGGSAPPQPGTPPHWHVWFAADDVEALVAKSTELGGRVDVGPTKASIGTFALLRDPSGAAFSVIKGNTQEG